MDFVFFQHQTKPDITLWRYVFFLKSPFFMAPHWPRSRCHGANPWAVWPRFCRRLERAGFTRLGGWAVEDRGWSDSSNPDEYPYVWLYIYTYIHNNTANNTDSIIHTHTCTYTYTCTYTHSIHPSIHPSVRPYVRTYIRTYVYIYKYTHTYIYIYIYLHTHIYIDVKRYPMVWRSLV